MNQKKMWAPALAILMSITCASLSQAQTRTWVSGVGSDANPCSRTAPCKTFAGALSKTSAGGEISVLDPGGYGSVTITKSITIDGGGFVASILASGVSGVIVNAGPNDVVILRNLSINGAGTGTNGVRLVAGGALHIQKCDIHGFNAGTAFGIDIEPSAASRVFIEDTTLRNNGIFATNVGGGILVKPGAVGGAGVSLHNVTIDRNVTGIRVNNNGSVFLRDSVIAGNSQHGLVLESTANGPVAAFLDHVSVVANQGSGLVSSGSGAVARITNSTFSGNFGTGLSAVLSGQIFSFGTNNNDGNGTNGAPTAFPAQQ